MTQIVDAYPVGTLPCLRSYLAGRLPHFSRPAWALPVENPSPPGRVPRAGIDDGYGVTMGKRWTDKDVDDLKRLAQHYPAHEIAEMLDRSVGGVAFKAHQLKVSLRPRNSFDAGPAGFNWDELEPERNTSPPDATPG